MIRILLLFALIFPVVLPAQKNIQLTRLSDKSVRTISPSNVNGLQTGKTLYAGKITAITDSTISIRLMPWRNIRPDSTAVLDLDSITKVYVCSNPKKCAVRVHKIIGRPLTRLNGLTGLAAIGFFAMGQPVIGGAFTAFTAGMVLIERNAYRKQVFDVKNKWKLSMTGALR